MVLTFSVSGPLLSDLREPTTKPEPVCIGEPECIDPEWLVATVDTINTSFQWSFVNPWAVGFDLKL